MINSIFWGLFVQDIAIVVMREIIHLEFKPGRIFLIG